MAMMITSRNREVERRCRRSGSSSKMKSWQLSPKVRLQSKRYHSSRARERHKVCSTTPLPRLAVLRTATAYPSCHTRILQSHFLCCLSNRKRSWDSPNKLLRKMQSEPKKNKGAHRRWYHLLMSIRSTLRRLESWRTRQGWPSALSERCITSSSMPNYNTNAPSANSNRKTVSWTIDCSNTSPQRSFNKSLIKIVCAATSIC